MSHCQRTYYNCVGIRALGLSLCFLLKGAIKGNILMTPVSAWSMDCQARGEPKTQSSPSAYYSASAVSFDCAIVLAPASPFRLAVSAPDCSSCSSSSDCVLALSGAVSCSVCSAWVSFLFSSIGSCCVAGSPLPAAPLCSASGPGLDCSVSPFGPSACPLLSRAFCLSAFSFCSHSKYQRIKALPRGLDLDASCRAASFLCASRLSLWTCCHFLWARSICSLWRVR